MNGLKDLNYLLMQSPKSDNSVRATADAFKRI